MATYSNPANDRYAIVGETVAGTTNATPAFLVVKDTGSTAINSKANQVASAVLDDTRSGNGTRKTAYWSEGTIATELKRTPSSELLFSSVLSNAWVSNDLKGGNVDKSFTVEKRFTATDGNSYFHRAAGCQVSKMTLSADTGSLATISYDLMGQQTTSGTTIITGATYAEPASTLTLGGIDLRNFSITGLATTPVSSVELSVERTIESLAEMGSTSSLGIATTGSRKVTLTVKLYKSNLSQELLFGKSDTPVAVSFDLGTGANGYKFSLPAATYDEPQDEKDGAKSLVTLVFTAMKDATAGTDIVITKL